MQDPPDGDAARRAEVDFEPEAVLDRDAHVLLDPRLLGPLHEEIEGELGERAASTLVQMGFLHGLQDATRALSHAVEHGEVGMPLRPPLVIGCHPRPGDRLELHGVWPDAAEASGRVRSLGGATGPVCHMSAGYTSGWLSGTLGEDLLALEMHCAATGDSGCSFVARTFDAWRAQGDPRACTLLDALPIDDFRAVVERRERVEPDAQQSDRFDRDSAVIHIWGPVMVIPFSGPDEALQAVELIGRDAGARDVTVVIVDLDHAVLDEAFGALAIEQIVSSIESWGAEAILAEPGPLSEGVIADLSHPPLMVVKDLDEAIAVAFRIAESQRLLV